MREAKQSRNLDISTFFLAFNSADYVPPYTIFDVGGNNYRVMAIARYRFKKIYVQQAMTHREYDNWNKRYRKGQG